MMANSTAFRKGEKRPNQGKHGPPKATLDARKAIAAFVDDNAYRLTQWLDQVAQGVVDPSDESKMLVRPDPAKAFDMFQSVIEYHIPKLARTENTGPDGGPLQVVIQRFSDGAN